MRAPKQDLSFLSKVSFFSLKIHLLLGWLTLNITYAKTQNFAFFREKPILYLQKSSLITWSRDHSYENTTKYTPCTPLWGFSCSTHLAQEVVLCQSHAFLYFVRHSFFNNDVVILRMPTISWILYTKNCLEKFYLCHS